MKNWKTIVFIIVATAAIVLFLSACSKRNECNDMRAKVGITHANKEAAYNAMMDHTTNETVAAYQEAEQRDSIATAIMVSSCDECKSCHN